jgi:hypothetical protein
MKKMICDYNGDETVLRSIGHASRAAKESGRVIWVYVSEMGFLWITDERPGEHRKIVAKCYPGGRNECKIVLGSKENEQVA